MQAENHSKKKRFAERVKKLRRAKGWSQVQLAQQIPVHSGLVASWETGRSLPRPDNLLRLAAVLGVTAQQLEEDDPSEIQQGAVPYGSSSPSADMASGMAQSLREYLDASIRENMQDPARLGWMLHEMRRLFGPTPEPALALNDAAGDLTDNQRLVLDIFRDLVNEKLRQRGLARSAAERN